MFVKVSWKEQRMVWNKSTWPSTQPYSKKRMVSTRFIAANRFSAFKPDHYQAVGMLELPIYLPPPLSLPPSPFLTSFGVHKFATVNTSLFLSLISSFHFSPILPLLIFLVIRLLTPTHQNYCMIVSNHCSENLNGSISLKGNRFSPTWNGWV